MIRMPAALLSLLFLGFLAPGLFAENETLLRTITSLEGGIAVGDTQPTEFGPAFGLRVLNLFDPKATEGAYWSLGTSASVSISSVSIVDTQPLGVGWRGRLFGLPIGGEAGVSLAVGSRYADGEIYKSTLYAGIAPRLGLIIPITETFDLAMFTWPVFNVMRFGSGNGPYSSYGSLVLAVSWKSFKRITDLPWNDETSAPPSQ